MNKPHVIQLRAAGGVLYKPNSSPLKVLLIKRNGFWDIPKGKLEEGETIEECAVREVEEEVGAEDLSIDHYLRDTYHEFNEGDRVYGKTTSWYSMKFERDHYDFKPEVREGITEVKWADIDEAKSLVEFQNLVDVLNALD